MPAHPPIPDPSQERDAHLPPTLFELAKRWIPRATAVALAASLFVHLLGWWIATMVGLGGGQIGGARPGKDQGFDMAIVSDAAFSQVRDEGLPQSLPGAPDELTPEPTQIGAIQESIKVDDLSLGGVNEGSSGVGLEGSGDIDGGSLVGAPGSGTLGGSGTGASFFGVEASGTRFAVICDTSASMADNNRIARLKLELVQTIKALAENAEFIVVGFDDDATVLSDRRGWSDATEAAKKRIFPRIEALEMGSSTQPLSAFQLVMGLKPRADAIYFMTDGEFEGRVVQEVALMNKKFSPAIPVHCICFGSDQGAGLMQQIAEQSKGTYTFIENPK